MPTDHDRKINSFAIRSFRDIAENEYVVARLACRAQLIPQFMWAAGQAIEKYLKCILCLYRVPARHVRNDLGAALVLLRKLPFTVKIRPPALKFIQHLDHYTRHEGVVHPRRPATLKTSLRGHMP